MKKKLGYLLLTVSLLLIVVGIGCLTYIYLFADAPIEGFPQLIAWVNLVNGLLGLVHGFNYYHNKA